MSRLICKLRALVPTVATSLSVRMILYCDCGTRPRGELFKPTVGIKELCWMSDSTWMGSGLSRLRETELKFGTPARPKCSLLILFRHLANGRQLRLRDFLIPQWEVRKSLA